MHEAGAVSHGLGGRAGQVGEQAAAEKGAGLGKQHTTEGEGIRGMSDGRQAASVLGGDGAGNDQREEGAWYPFYGTS